MRRLFYWFIPLTISVAAAAIFAVGFTSFLRGDIGAAVGPTTSATRSSVRTVTLTPLILGDSLARGTGDQTGLGIGGRLAADLKQEHLDAHAPVNIAVNGARTGDLLRQLDSRNVRTLIAQSNPIIISIGGNDLWGDTAEMRQGPPATSPASREGENPALQMKSVLDRIAQIVTIVRETNPTARIFLIGLYNPLAQSPGGAIFGALVAEWNARVLERFALDPNITLVPTADLFSHHRRLSADNFHPGDEGYALIARRIADSL